MKKGKRQRDRRRQAGLVFALLLLCGCTKKEELLFLNGENAAEMPEDRSVYSEDIGGQAGAVRRMRDGICRMAKARELRRSLHQRLYRRMPRQKIPV